MNNVIDILQNLGNSNSDSCLQKYLEKQEAKTKKILNGELANADFNLFKNSITNLTTQIDQFIDTSERKRSFLVLGQIQSGKTAHLLGNIAWAADSRLATAAIFTGITNPLNEQTIDRITEDLASLGDHFIKIMRVPTSSKSPEFKKLWETVKTHIEWRMQNQESGIPAPLPVFVLIKNKQRITTLGELYKKIYEEFGKNITNLLIDDEADQASQNTGAQKREIAQTYGAISALLEISSRVVMLSYTATPQAVLLSEKLGKLRPDRCVTVSPRNGYFGLDLVAGQDFQPQRIEVSDWNLNARNLVKRPRSLEKAVLEFFVLAWLRFNKPHFFYTEAANPQDLDNQLKSVQMLIHESSRQIRHEQMYKFINSYVEDYAKRLRNLVVNDRNMEAEIQKLGLTEVVNEIRVRLNIEETFLRSVEEITDLFSLMNNTSILVVNASSTRPNREVKFPVKNSEWETKRTWILIGGDILGRGLTIPQLITTYFLRTANTPNFDTVAQQMRFCGYREHYSKVISIHAPIDTFNSFRYMDVINRTVWKRALQWDRGRRDLRNNPPSIMYATPANFNMEPCRRAVRDPDLIDSSITKGTIVSLKDIYKPAYLKENIRRLNNWITETSADLETFEDWEVIHGVDPQKFQRLVGGLVSNRDEIATLNAAAEIFDLDLGELGLEHSIINVAIRKSTFELRSGSNSDLDKFYKKVKIFRKVIGNTANLNFSDWKRDYLKLDPQVKSWPKLQTHIGDEQRSLRDSLSVDSTLLIVEPVIGTSKVRDKSSGFCLGLAVTLLAPSSYEVRIIGHK